MSQPTIIRRSATSSFLAIFVLLAGAAGWLSCYAGAPVPRPTSRTPEERAIDYLGREVPLWQRVNHCYSCHNNGDGARALLEARKQGFPLPAQCLEDTREWFEQPLNWDRHDSEGGSKDKTLSHIQFARALASMPSQARGAAAAEAADIVAKDQKPAGYWRIDDGGPGTPCTYGNALATAQACRTLEMLAPRQYAEALRRAERWLANQPRNSLVDQVAVIFGLEHRREELCRDAGAAILVSQNADGGWGPYATSGSEPFDTAIAILALARLPDAATNLAAIERGRRYLLVNQQDDGGWIETTRPPGAVSYAQRLSTSGWATLALLATRNRNMCR